MSTTNKLNYTTPTSSSGGLTSLGTSSTFVAGYEWFYIDNSTELALDYMVQGVIRVGTTPTVNTEIRIYAFGVYDGSTYPDVFDGTPSAETLTSVGVGAGFLKLAAVLICDSTTSARDYPFFFTLASLFGGIVPKKVGFFVTHNTGVNLDSTAGNHLYNYGPINSTNG